MINNKKKNLFGHEILILDQIKDNLLCFLDKLVVYILLTRR